MADKKRTWRDVAGARNPDLNLDDDEAVAAWLEQSFQDSDKMADDRKKLDDLLIGSPQAAGILQGLSSGVGADGEPFSLMGYLMENYWDEIQAAKSTEEAEKIVRKKEAEKIEKAAKDAQRQKDNSDKLAKMDEQLTEAMAMVNTDEATVNSMLEWLYGKDKGFIYRAISYDLTKDDWAKLLFAFDRDAQLDKARTDGGRQTRNNRGKPHRSLKDDMPADLGGGGSDSGEETDTDPTIRRYQQMGRRRMD